MARAISYSRISNFLGDFACELEDYWTYDQGRWPPQASYFAYGSAIHEAIAATMRIVAQDGELPPFGRTLQVYQDAFDREAAETEFDEDEDPEQMRRTWGEALEVWHREEAPHYRPHAADARNVEVKFFLPLEGFSRPLKGKIDLIADYRVDPEMPWEDVPNTEPDEKDPEGGPGIVDWKTGKRYPQHDKIDREIQPTVYRLAFMTDPNLQERIEADDLNWIRYGYILNKGPGLTPEEAAEKSTDQWNVQPDEMANWRNLYGPGGDKEHLKRKPHPPRDARSYSTWRTDAHIDWFSVIYDRVTGRLDQIDRVRATEGEDAARRLWVPVGPDHWKCHPDNCPHYAYCRGAVTGEDA